jgi:hypothetical protein
MKVRKNSYNKLDMNETEWPRTLQAAVYICLLTLTPEEKELIKYTPQDKLIWFDFEWAINMRNEFGMWEGNEELIRSCRADNPDDASMVIVKAVWRMLR